MILTHCGKFGDFIPSLVIPNYYYKNNNEKTTFILSSWFKSIKGLEEFLMLYEKHNTYKDQKPSLNSNVLNDSRATMYKTSENFVNKYFATYKFVEKMMYMYESILELRKISSVDIIDIKREMIIPDGKRVIEVGGRSKKSRKSRKSRR